MKILVAHASKHGSTPEIAAAIARILSSEGADVDLLTARDVTAVDQYDAVIIGSAAYMGRWLDPARDLAAREAVALRQRPVWLFSCGPVGEPLKARDHAVDVTEIVELTHASEHRLFAGKVTRERMGFVERAVVTALRVPDGDFRDWNEIHAWAAQIGKQLLSREAVATAGSRT